MADETLEESFRLAPPTLVLIKKW